MQDTVVDVYRRVFTGRIAGRAGAGEESAGSGGVRGLEPDSPPRAFQGWAVGSAVSGSGGEGLGVEGEASFGRPCGSG